MERVAFLVERTGQRIGALLNPDTLVVRRLSGVRQQQVPHGPLAGAELRDDPLLFTGGGSTELLLDLLFDVSLAGANFPGEDVRQLTAPLWDLSENQADDGGRPRPPLVRFVWGKSWNVPGIVAAVSERLEYFTTGGVPRRSWLRMRLLRVEESEAARPPARPLVMAAPEIAGAGAAPPEWDGTEPSATIVGAPGETADAPGDAGPRLDELAFRWFGDASLWRLVAAFNGVADPLDLPAGQRVRMPQVTAGDARR